MREGGECSGWAACIGIDFYFMGYPTRNDFAYYYHRINSVPMIRHDLKLNFKILEGGPLHCPDYLEGYYSYPLPHPGPMPRLL